jgi:hypothetical protein
MLVHEDPFAVRNEKCVQTEDNGPGDHESASKTVLLKLKSPGNKEINTPKIDFGSLEKNGQSPEKFYSPAPPSMIKLKPSAQKGFQKPAQIDRSIETRTSQEIKSPAR